MIKFKHKAIAGIVAVIALVTIESSIGQDNSPKSASQTAKAMKKKQWMMARRAKHTRDSALKAHMKHQSKSVRKRMKKDAKKAKITNQGGDY